MLEKFKTIRRRTEQLCAPLHPEDMVPQPAEFASPTKWHLAHTTWFFEEMVLAKFKTDYKRFHPDFAFLFNSYYNTIGNRTFRAERGLITRPTVAEVLDYRSFVNAAMESFIKNLESNHKALEIIELGLNHEQQHQELLMTDLKYTLAQNPTFPVYQKEANWVNQTNQETGFISIPEGIYTIGFAGDGFHLDNEKGQHKVFVQDFDISKSLVTNGEYLEFIADGGYQNFNFWLDEGWSWVNENNITAPLYWHKIDNQWHQFTLAGLQKVNPDAQLAHVNFYEANAFATWKGMRLPTEFEWEIASEQFLWGSRWEWTNSAYLPYPGFKTAAGAVGEYNGKFMINQMVLRGASVATAEKHSRKTYRNFFHPQLQWQFSGIRLAK